VDVFTQQRVWELRREIAAVQRDNESYRGQKRHTASEINTNELRRLRLLAIKVELLRACNKTCFHDGLEMATLREWEARLHSGPEDAATAGLGSGLLRSIH